MNLRRYESLKTKAETLKREADKARGALEQLKKTLNEEFDCSSLKAANKLLGDLEKQQIACEKKFAEELDIFESAFEEKLS